MHIACRYAKLVYRDANILCRYEDKSMGCLQVLSPAKMAERPADDEIGKILSKIQLQTLMSRFRDQKLTTISICKTLTDSQLVDLGLLTIGDRIQIKIKMKSRVYPR